MILSDDCNAGFHAPVCDGTVTVDNEVGSCGCVCHEMAA